MRYITALPALSWEQERPRSVVLLGSTGSIGVNALKVIESCPEAFRVLGLAAGNNAQRLAEQASCHRPPFLAVRDAATATALRALLPADYAPEVLVGPEGYATMAALPEASTVLAAQVGAAGLAAAMAAARAGKVIALANKEALVLAGDLLRATCATTGAVILPVDSEHNAIFQALAGREPEHVQRVILTASGGPFRGKDAAFLRQVTPEAALRHPNWSMGAKISIDSATLMNKGLEVIEARHLYGLPAERIGVLVHPQSIVHSLVEFTDRSLMAQMGTPDMRLPIAHCLNWPRCAPVGAEPLDLARLGTLTFEEADLHSFPCLALARRTLDEGGSSAIVLNAANEVVVEAFLQRRIGFMDMPALIERAMDSLTAAAPDGLEAIEDMDRQTRRLVAGWIS